MSSSKFRYSVIIRTIKIKNRLSLGYAAVSMVRIIVYSLYGNNDPYNPAGNKKRVVHKYLDNHT